MKKYISIAIVIAALVGLVWYVCQSKNPEILNTDMTSGQPIQAENILIKPTETTVVKKSNVFNRNIGYFQFETPHEKLSEKGITTIVKGDIVSVVDTQTGISFTYPSVWGKLQILEDENDCPVSIKEPCVNRSYEVFVAGATYPKTIIAVETESYSKYPRGRGGSLSDYAGYALTPVKDWCTEAVQCELVANTQGTVFAKKKGVLIDMEEPASKRNERIGYYVTSDKGPYKGIFLTAADMVDPADSVTKVFESVVVGSLKLNTH